MNRDHWFGAVRARIDHHLRTGDAEPLLAEASDHEATQLAISIHEEDLAAIQALGELRWYKHLALTQRGQQAESELDTALRHFAIVYRADPQCVPEPVRRLFASTDALARDPVVAITTAMNAIQSGDRRQLDHAIDTLYHAHALLFPGIPLAEAMSRVLSMVLLQRYTRYTDSGDILDLERAIARLTSWKQRDDEQARRILGKALYLRGERTSNLADLDQAVTLLRETVRDLTADHPVGSEWLSGLSSALYARSLLTGSHADLNDAITLSRQAISASAAEGNNQAHHFAHLSVLLRHRYEVTGDGDALDEAVVVARKGAVDNASPDCRAALGRALVTQFQRTRRLSHLTEAITVFRRELNARRTHDAVSDLGAALLQYEKVVPSDQLEEAITLLQEARDTAPSPDRHATALANIGAALYEQWQRTKNLALLDEIVDIFHEVTGQQTNPSRLAHALHSYASALEERSTNCASVLQEQSAHDLAAAIEASRTLAKMPEAAVAERINAAHRWGAWAARAGFWVDSAEGYQYAVGLLPEIAPQHLRRGEQEQRLIRWGMLASDAAAAALNSGRPESALELLEQGRGLLQSAALDIDRELGELRVGAPQLATDLEKLREEIGTTRTDADRRHELAERWIQLLAEIRQRPGLGRFLRTPNIEALKQVAEDGPVITVNVSSYRSDALVLHSAGVRVVRLDELDYDDLTRRSEAFSDALRSAENPALSLVTRLTAQDTLREALGWLWDTVTGPVLSALGHHTLPRASETWPRVWWSPTGPLTLLPLHAAGHDDLGVSALDGVVSSYTPTIRALAHARQAPVRKGRTPLIVAMRETSGYPALPAALAEATDLAVQNAADLMVDNQATRRNVLQALPHHGWAHFACHAHFDPDNPYTSHLVLHDQPVTVTDIARLRVPNAELAYLSACSTGRSSAELTGEAIHLGSAFQLAGFRHVIATMWQVHDETATQIATNFYINRSDHDTAHALHAAVRRAKDAYSLLPSRWAAHTHTGP